MYSQEPDFSLREFSVWQPHTAMKVGTDAVALGAWVASLPIVPPRRVLDVGTGTGILALMMAQAFPQANVWGIDIEPNALEDARHNVSHSPFRERVTIEEHDFTTYRSAESFDLIISNPPYFPSDALHSPDAKRSIARAECADGLNIARLISHALTMMCADAKLCLVLPFDRLEELRRIACEHLLIFRTLCYVSSGRGSETVRILACLERLKLSAPYIETPLEYLPLREAGGAYTEEYRQLTDAYLCT